MGVAPVTDSWPTASMAAATTIGTAVNRGRFLERLTRPMEASRHTTAARLLLQAHVRRAMGLARRKMQRGRSSSRSGSNPTRSASNLTPSASSMTRAATTAQECTADLRTRITTKTVRHKVMARGPAWLTRVPIAHRSMNRRADTRRGPARHTEAPLLAETPSRATKGPAVLACSEAVAIRAAQATARLRTTAADMSRAALATSRLLKCRTGAVSGMVVVVAADTLVVGTMVVGIIASKGCQAAHSQTERRAMHSKSGEISEGREALRTAVGTSCGNTS